MAYTLREKQRAFQRDWWKKKREGEKEKKRIETEKISERQGRSILHDINRFEQIKLKGIVTWDELTQIRLEVRKVKTWDCCVEKCKEYLNTRKINRCAVAYLAIRGCKIKHGGLPVKENLKEFSDAVGVHYKTLSGWVRVVLVIVENLPDTEKIVDWSACDLAIRNPDKSKIVEVYKNLSNPENINQKNLVSFLKKLKGVFRQIQKHHSQLDKEMTPIQKKFVISVFKYCFLQMENDNQSETVKQEIENIIFKF